MVPNVYHPKVAKRVRVYYHHCGRLDECADRIEKVGKAEGGSKKNKNAGRKIFGNVARRFP